MSEANKELVRRHFEEILNRKDLAVADELMAQDYVEHAVAPFGQAEPGRVNGPAAMRETAQWLLAQFPDLQMTVEAIVADGDTVAVRVLSEGTNLGPLNGVVPPTGKRFSARGVTGSGSRTKLAEHWATVRTSRRCCLGVLRPQVDHLPRTLRGWEPAMAKPWRCRLRLHRWQRLRGPDGSRYRSVATANAAGPTATGGPRPQGSPRPTATGPRVAKRPAVGAGLGWVIGAPPGTRTPNRCLKRRHGRSADLRRSVVSSRPPGRLFAGTVRC